MTTDIREIFFPTVPKFKFFFPVAKKKSIAGPLSHCLRKIETNGTVPCRVTRFPINDRFREQRLLCQRRLNIMSFVCNLAPSLRLKIMR